MPLGRNLQPSITRFLCQIGVTHRGERARAVLARERATGRAWPFALTILEELSADWRADDEPLLERLYGALAAGTNVFKTTHRGRFAELDARLAQDCATRFSSVDRLVVHDMAASSAITSIELYLKLSAVRPTRLVASDRYDRLYLVDNRGWTTVFDAEGRALQFVGRGLVLSALGPESLATSVNRLVQAWVQRTILPAATQACEQARLGQPTTGCRIVPLFHPDAVRAAAEDANFILARHDLMDRDTEQCHVARIMNLLTPAHMTDEQMRRATAAATTGLVDGGLLIVGRSVDEQDGHTRATAFERRGQRLAPAWSIGEGCERQDVIGAIAVGA